MGLVVGMASMALQLGARHDLETKPSPPGAAARTVGIVDRLGKWLQLLKRRQPLL